MSLYVYQASVVKVVDGDTFDLLIDPGFMLTYAARVRLYGWDTPERYRGSDHERDAAARATEHAAEWLDRHADHLLVRTHKADSFGRWLAEVFYTHSEGHEVHLGTDLAAWNLATEWPMRWRDLYDTEEAPT